MDISCTSPESARQYLRDVEPMWRAFWLHSHLVAKNLTEFVAGLEAIDEEVYRFHQVSHENAMSSWVQEVVGDSVLAEALRQSPDLTSAVTVAKMRLKELTAAAQIHN